MIRYEMLDDMGPDGHYMLATYSDGASAEIVAKYPISYPDDPEWMTPDQYAEMILDCATLCQWDIACEIEEREERMDARDRWARGGA